MASSEEIIKRAEETIKTARHGYEDLTGSDRSRRYTGLRNLIVFGRSVTFVLQNLKSSVGEEKFSAWYDPHQDQLKADPVMKYFVTLRNELEKQGKLPVSSSVHIHEFSTETLSKYPRPPGAKGFFIGDQMGGSGWEIELPDGSTEKYYIVLPKSVAEVKQIFNEFPLPDDHDFKQKSIEELSDHFLSTLERILDSARLHFLNQSVQTVNGKRLPPYLRVVK